jgi:hypothetical protein
LLKRYFRLVLFLLLIGAVLIVQAQDATPDPDSQVRLMPLE